MTVIARTITIVLLSIVSVIGGVAVSAQEKLTAADNQTYQKAIDLAKKSNNTGAVELLRVLSDKYPQNIDVAYNLGICYVNMSGNPDSALYFLKKVLHLKKSPDWAENHLEVLMAMAKAYQMSGNYDAALKIYTEITRNDDKRVYADIIGKEIKNSEFAKVYVANPVKITFRVLGDNVNSRWNDYRPLLSASEDTMFFTSRRPKNNARKDIVYDDGQFEEGIYRTIRIGNKWDDGTWSEAEPISGLIVDEKGQSGQETATSLGNHGTELYLVHEGDIYVSYKDPQTGKWSKAEPLPEPINTKYGEHYAYVTDDGQTMYLSTEVPGGFGGKDIWRSRRLPNGQWGVPVNLGPNINTEADEDAPFFHEATKMLYFSSNGHNTMGGYDIFFSPENDEAFFDIAQNVGFPINSPDDDMFFVPSEDFDRAFYATIHWNDDGTSTSYNIYEVEFVQPEQNRMVVIAAEVEADTLSDVLVYTLRDGHRIGVGRPNTNTGRFVSIVDAGGTIELEAEYNGEKIRQMVNTRRSDSYFVRQQPINVRPFVFASNTKTLNMELAKDEDEEASGTPHSNLRNMGGYSVGGWRNWITTNEKPYTVQLLSSRKHLEKNRIQGLDIDSVAEYSYRDGWVVYSFGAYPNYSTARKAQHQIRKTTKYKDAFARNANQYKKFIDRQTDDKKDSTKTKGVNRDGLRKIKFNTKDMN